MKLRCLLLSLLSFPIFAQDPSENSLSSNDLSSFWVWGAETHYGFIIPHHKFLREISQSRPWGVSFSVSKHFVNQKVWDLYGCFPRVGGKLNYFNFGNPRQLGSAITALGFVEPYFSYGRLKSSMRLATGPALMTVVYDAEKNPENQFVSSHLSFKMSAQFSLTYSLSSKWALRSSFTFNHISNGGIKEPNRGINFPTATLGLEYCPSRPQFPRLRREKTIQELHPKRFGYEVAGFFSGKKLEAFPSRFPVFGMAATANYIVGKTSMLRGGFELCRDLSLLERNRSGESHNPNTAALVLGHDLLMGRFRLQTHLGAYLIKPNSTQMLTYQRYGLDFRFWKGFYLGISLKSHTFTADFMDVRFGFRI
jgi:hypothetical protein